MTEMINGLRVTKVVYHEVDDSTRTALRNAGVLDYTDYNTCELTKDSIEFGRKTCEQSLDDQLESADGDDNAIINIIDEYDEWLANIFGKDVIQALKDEVIDLVMII